MSAGEGMRTGEAPAADTTGGGAAAEMASRYDPVQVEGAMRSLWEGSGGFGPSGEPGRRPFTIMIPPPNVTGVLHVGHALNGTIQDIVVRHRRMAGFDALWVPGTDHAGIATQAVVEKTLYAERRLTRQQMGREAFLAEVWAWKEEHGGKILEQFARLGTSCDWSRTRFTLDPAMSRAVREAFVRLWERGLVYRGARLVNWDCVLQTAVSDDEIEYQPRRGRLWTLRYPVLRLADGSPPGARGAPAFVEVATTRPETMLGDTGVAVHPDDPRWSALVGATLRLPLAEREIPVVADESVDPAFGTGAVKVTPGHDPADYERGARHKLPIISLLEPDGRLNANAGAFAGMPRETAREAVVAALETAGLLAGSVEIEHNVSVSDRSKSPIEPLVSEQWFVRMEPLAGPAIEAVRSGALRFKPERWSKVYLDWLLNVRDWCISRQLWWGHRIPVWYDEDGAPVASREDLALGSPHPTTGKPLVRQDEDVLDTWASSWLWPLSTLGWPEATPDLARHYPTQLLSTASEIIYLWVARMVMAGYAFADHLPAAKRCPFATCYVHATVLDAQGQRMSKSKGNGIDPLVMIDQYGADAVRFSLILLTKEGQDTRLAPEKFEMGRSFVNKLWNASRFVLGKAGRLPELATASGAAGGAKSGAESGAAGRVAGGVVALEDRWILSRLAATIEAVGAAWERYEFNDGANLLYRFVWNDVCDWYVEAVKPRLGAAGADSAAGAVGAQGAERAAGAAVATAAEAGGGAPGDPVAAAVLGRVLRDALALLHPIAPFVTEAVWQRLREASEAELPPVLMRAPWPDGAGLRRDEASEADLELAQAVVSSVRKLRQQNGVAERQPAKVTVALADETRVASLRRAEALVRRLGIIERLDVGVSPERPSGAAADIHEGVEVLLDLDGLIDREAQRRDLQRSLDRLEKQLGALDAKLGNEQFVARAPAEVVGRERARRDELCSERGRLQGLLAALG